MGTDAFIGTGNRCSGYVDIDAHRTEQRIAAGIGYPPKGHGSGYFSEAGQWSRYCQLRDRADERAIRRPGSKQPHVAQALGVLGQPTSELFTSVQGVNFPELERMSGGIAMVAGHVPTDPNDLLVDQYYAQQNHIHVGQKWKVLNHEFNVSGIMQGGVLGRLMIQLPTLQNLTSNTGMISQILVKLDDPARTNEEVERLNEVLKGNLKAVSMEAILSQFNINNIPQLKVFISVITGLAVLVGFLVVFLSMYTAVVERTREIGILKALGAKPHTIADILVREALVLAVLGCIIGIALSFVAKSVITGLHRIARDRQRAGLVAVGSGNRDRRRFVGAIYPGLKAARQDAIEALSYD